MFGFDGDRKSRHADEARMTEMRDKFKALGVNELGLYQGDKLSAAQQANLTGYEDTTTASANQFAQKAGAAGYKGNALETDLHDQIKMDSIIIGESMKAKTLQKALQALGYSMEETKALIKKHQEEQQQDIASFTGLMKTVGTVAMFAALA